MGMMTKTTLVDRALVRLSGEDVRGFLQGLVTNDVLGPLPVWAGLLTLPFQGAGQLRPVLALAQ